MTRVVKPEKSKPIPHDPVLAAQEVGRRETLRNDVSYQSGVQQALHNALENQKRIVETRIADVRKKALKRDMNQQSRASYERCYDTMKQEVLRLAGMTGKPVTGVPPHYPPIAEVEATITIEPPPFDLGQYKAYTGNGAVPLVVPGTSTDWTAS